MPCSAQAQEKAKEKEFGTNPPEREGIRKF